MDLELSARRAIVTGSTRGLGWVIAQRLAEQGCAVAVCGRSLEQVIGRVDQLRAMGTPAVGEALDLTDVGSLDVFVERVAATFGGIDLVIANAGGSTPGGPLDDEAWVGAYTLSVAHPVRLIHAALPHLRQSPAPAIVAISSVSATGADPEPAYAAAKAAENSLARTLSWALAEARIRVNVVAPGSLESPGWERFEKENPEAFRRFRAHELPWRRLGTYAEVADVVCFLLSVRSSWINGAVVPVDGAQGHPHANSGRVNGSIW